MKTLVCWSGGKDCGLALHRLRANPSVDVCGLLTTFSEEFDRVSMHGVRRELLENQAAAVGLPLRAVFLPTPPAAAPCPIGSANAQGFTAFPSNDTYDEAMGRALAGAKRDGIEAIAFGDIFLEDLRRYREERTAAAGLATLFPLWGEKTGDLLAESIASGFRAVTVCVDSRRLSEAWAGREIDARFAREIPAEVDPCGEYGEYHSFVHDGPGFRSPVAFERGEVVFRDPFWFADLRPSARARIESP